MFVDEIMSIETPYFSSVCVFRRTAKQILDAARQEDMFALKKNTYKTMFLSCHSNSKAAFTLQNLGSVDVLFQSGWLCANVTRKLHICSSSLQNENTCGVQFLETVLIVLVLILDVILM